MMWSILWKMFFSSIDMTSGYFQMAPKESQNSTAFVTPVGLHKWKPLPMGLASAPGALQNLMELVFSGLSYETALVYLDNLIVFGKTFEELSQRLDQVLVRLEKSDLKIKGSKCEFFQKRNHFLGHVVFEKRVEVDQEKVASWKNEITKQFKRSTSHASTLTKPKCELGLVCFYRKFIPSCG